MDRLSYLAGICFGATAGVGFSTVVVGWNSHPDPSTYIDHEQRVIVLARPTGTALATAAVLSATLGTLLLYHKLSSE